MHAIPTDRVDASVNFLDCCRKIAAARGYSQDATAGSLPAAALLAGAGMKNKAFAPISHFFKPADLLACFIRTGITASAKDHTHSRIRIPSRADSLQRAVHGGLQQRHEIAL